MEQKDYKMEILLELLKGENHVRAIAKSLGTNHMNISRKMKELSKENVVDYREEGKNKTFFLKKTGESRAYVLTAENYKLILTLQKYPSLQSLILHSHEAPVYRKVKGKSRGSSKGNKVLPMRCAPLGHPERDF